MSMPLMWMLQVFFLPFFHFFTWPDSLSYLVVIPTAGWTLSWTAPPSTPPHWANLSYNVLFVRRWHVWCSELSTLKQEGVLLFLSCPSHLFENWLLLHWQSVVVAGPFKVIKSIVISVHAPVLLSIALPNLPLAERHWCFKSTLISDKSFFKFIEEQITFYFKVNAPSETSSLFVWDVFNAYIRGQIISYTANMKKQKQTERQLLIDKIKNVAQQYTVDKNPNVYKTQM